MPGGPLEESTSDIELSQARALKTSLTAVYSPSFFLQAGNSLIYEHQRLAGCRFKGRMREYHAQSQRMAASIVEIALPRKGSLTALAVAEAVLVF
jgi:hypothetical protein